MKTVSNALKNKIRKSHGIWVHPYMEAEFALNRYADPEIVNVPSDEEIGYDLELYPLDSVIDPQRPLNSPSKARVGVARLLSLIHI